MSWWSILTPLFHSLRNDRLISPSNALITFGWENPPVQEPREDLDWVAAQPWKACSPPPSTRRKVKRSDMLSTDWISTHHHQYLIVICPTIPLAEDPGPRIASRGQTSRHCRSHALLSSGWFTAQYDIWLGKLEKVRLPLSTILSDKVAVAYENDDYEVCYKIAHRCTIFLCHLDMEIWWST